MSDAVCVKLGDVKVLAGSGTMYAVGLGSCVAVVLYDAESRIGGFAHVMLPENGSNDTRPGRYAMTAVPHLLEMMASAGASAERIYARIAGGAAMFAEALPVAARMGERNIVAVKAALEQAGIPIKGEEVGGSSGRSVYFDAQDGTVTVRVVQKADVVL